MVSRSIIGEDDSGETALSFLNMTCYKCKQKGHRGRECPDTKKKHGYGNNSRGGGGGSSMAIATIVAKKVTRR